MAEYRKGAHTVYDLKYHVVWATKYRYHVLKGVRWTLLSRHTLSKLMSVPFRESY